MKVYRTDTIVFPKGERVRIYNLDQDRGDWVFAAVGEHRTVVGNSVLLGAEFFEFRVSQRDADFDDAGDLIARCRPPVGMQLS